MAVLYLTKSWMSSGDHLKLTIAVWNAVFWNPWHFGANLYPHLWLMDPDPTLDPTSFFSDFKDANKLMFFSIFFSYNLPAGTLSSVLKFKFLLKFSVKILFCKHYFRKGREGSGAGSISLTNGSWSGSWRQKNIRIPNTGGMVPLFSFQSSFLLLSTLFSDSPLMPITD